MSSFEEHLFGRIAVLNGYITVEQLEECLEIQRNATNARPLLIGKILRSKGYLLEWQLKKIVDIRRNKVRKMMRNSEDLLQAERDFRRHVIVENIVSPGDMEEAVLEQRRLHRLNIQVTIWEVLVNLGRLAVNEVLEVLALKNHKIMTCRSCDLCFQVAGDSPTDRFFCTQCGRELTEPPYLDFVRTDGIVQGRPVVNLRDDEVDHELIVEAT